MRVYKLYVNSEKRIVVLELNICINKYKYLPVNNSDGLI